MTEHAIYTGRVWHARHQPTVHRFSYKMSLFWLDLDDLDSLSSTPGLSAARWAPVQFKRDDYLTNPELPLGQVAIERMSALAGKPLKGKVFLLGQLRLLGVYFSPVNFYYLRQENGHYSHALAEVSNTPWNERHHYLIDLDNPAETEKAFHVSPFNPMQMQYKWRVPQPDDALTLGISCYQGSRHFDALMKLDRQPVNSKTLRRVMLSTMSIKTVLAIYWQALKLWIKGTPLYTHSPARRSDAKQ
ncbi:DUF1365 domain-containing protein [Aliiglaciecola sp. CAU 1673]|uniref:DUF1365 domain-containing protein n=1 Tax=Aliiglaciecola sp. CAU 1673 TaxID=3032595 RepID=UPI0023DA6D2C|nr:DUF1365 domain-containing protein [Aliiglaciecola sp. CAU 1673]MDF2178209.1 DUF1365 domain-containing protein [Aliiglaciecola sp. CAU 1673]